jgi:hypothetical protein
MLLAGKISVCLDGDAEIIQIKPIIISIKKAPQARPAALIC